MTFIEKVAHKGFFINLGNRAMLAGLQLQLNSLPEIFGDHVELKEGAFFRLTWYPENSTDEEPPTCTAIVVPKMWGASWCTHDSSRQACQVFQKRSKRSRRDPQVRQTSFENEVQ